MTIHSSLDDDSSDLQNNNENYDFSDDTSVDMPSIFKSLSSYGLLPAQGHDIKQQRLELSKRNSLKDRICRSVCRPCSRNMGMRWAALCWNQCEKGGTAFDACITVLAALQSKKA